MTPAARRELWLNALYPSLALLVATVCYVGLLGRIGFNSHEAADPYLRVLEYMREFRAGHWLPQTFPDLYMGAGFAAPRFYPPMGNFVAAALTAATGDVVAGVNLSFLLSIVLSAGTMYVALAALTGSRVIALLGGVAYVAFPYRFSLVYVRGALAECWSLPWYPLLVLGWVRIRQHGRAPWYLPAAIACLILSHPQMTLYFATAGAVALLVWRPRPDLRMLVTVAAAALIGAGLAAWFWLPQLHYLPTVWASVPSAVWADPVSVAGRAVGFRESFTGPHNRTTLNPSVGWTAVLANLLVVMFWARRQEGDRAAWHAWARWLLVPWWLLWAFMVWPGPVLAVLPSAFGYIQFPWRVLGPMACLATLSLGLSLAALQSRKLTALAAVVVLGGLAVDGLSPRLHPEWTSDRLERLLATSGIQSGLTGASEFLPRSVAGIGSDYGRAVEALRGAIRSAPRASAGTVLRSYRRDGSASELDVESERGGVVVLPTVYYDFYDVSMADGRRITGRDSLGLLTLSVGPGRHLIRVQERLTPVNWIGIGVSAVTALLCVGILMSRRPLPP